jgi:hypothetical protein
VVTRPYAATETAGPGGEARCGDEPRTTRPPSWPSRRGERDRRRVRRSVLAATVYARQETERQDWRQALFDEWYNATHDFEMKAAQYIVKFIRVASVGE